MAVYFNETESKLEKKPKNLTGFTYDDESQGGCINKFDEAKTTISNIYTDIGELSTKYNELVTKYEMFSHFSDTMKTNITTLTNSADNIKKEFNNLLDSLKSQVEALQVNDSSLISELDSINKLISSSKGENSNNNNNNNSNNNNGNGSNNDSRPDVPKPAENNSTPGTETAGFVRPQGDNLETLYKIIAAEGGSTNPNEARNILAAMINRARSPEWSWAGGNDVYKQATHSGQFVVYENERYKNAVMSDECKAACNALFEELANGGSTPHNYTSFRRNGSGFGTELEPGGNSYK